jgi:hypothetical protein
VLKFRICTHRRLSLRSPPVLVSIWECELPQFLDVYAVVPFRFGAFDRHDV